MHDVTQILLKGYLENAMSTMVRYKESELESLRDGIALVKDMNFNDADYRVFVHKVTSSNDGVNYKHHGKLEDAVKGAISRAHATPGHENEKYTIWDFLIDVIIKDNHIQIPNECLKDIFGE